VRYPRSHAPMRLLSASDCITPAIERTKSLLFRPFQWKTFLKLTAVAFFAEIGGGSFSLGSGSNRNPGTIPGASPATYGLILAVLFALLLFALVFGLVMLYVGSRLQLVILEVVATRQTTIAPIWRRYSRLTWRWIGLKLLFFLLCGLVLLAVLTPVIFGMFRNMPSGGQPPAAAFFSHIVLFIGAIFLVVLVVGSAYLLLRDLALPFLALEDLSITDTLGRLRSVVTAAPGEIVLYLLLRFVLGLVAAIGAEIVIFLILLVSLIPFAIIGGVLWLALHHAGTVGTAALIASAIVGGLVLLAWMTCVCIGLVGTVFVFTQSYALYFLGGRYPLLGNILEPPQVAYPPPPPPLTAKDEGGPPSPMDPSPI
jgi:hypothetical protein